MVLPKEILMKVPYGRAEDHHLQHHHHQHAQPVVGGLFMSAALCGLQRNGIKVDSWVSTILHADSRPCAKSPTLKQVVLGRILTVLAQVWRVGSS